jgi:hypothetical protein
LDVIRVPVAATLVFIMYTTGSWSLLGIQEQGLEEGPLDFSMMA